MFPKQVVSKTLLFCNVIESQRHYEMLQFSGGKADAHNKIISVLLRHAQRHSDKFLSWMLSLEPYEKTLGSQNYVYVFIEK